MFAEEIRKLSVSEIQTQLEDAREELLRLRFRHATGELKDTNILKQTRQKIARYLSVLKEMETGAHREGEA